MNIKKLIKLFILATDEILRTYADVSRMEDVSPLVELISPTENYFLNNLGEGIATDMVHITLTDELRTVAANTVGEAADYTVLASSTPSRLPNVVNIVAIPYAVSRSQQHIKKHTNQDELARQTAKAILDWSNSAEYNLVRSTMVSGVSGTTAAMSGILEAISLAQTYSAQTSGTAFSATILAAMMKDAWDDGNGDLPTDVFVGSYIRQEIDTWLTKNATSVATNGADAQNIINATSLFVTSWGPVKIHAHRYLDTSSDATGRVLLVRPDKLKIAWLQKPYIDKGLARSGDYDKRAIVGKFTLEVKNQLGHVYHDGFNKG